MNGPNDAGDLSVVIPTRQRFKILHQTLQGLRRQDVGGFEVIVVVDGEDQRVPPLEGVRTIVVPQAGPGAARNVGAEEARGPIVLFLGDDMVPASDLLRRHLEHHRRHQEPHAALLGRPVWHRRSHGRVTRWLEWSGSQFDFGSVDGARAGFWHFYSCNVSLKRRFFLDAGGFDPSFTYYYEDLDCGYRLHQKGMELFFDQEAATSHLHPYDMAGLGRRFRGVGQGERHMVSQHPWFTPFFLERVRQASLSPDAGAIWPVLADWARRGPDTVRTRLQAKATTAYLQRLTAPFLEGWWREEEIEELRLYLGQHYDHRLLVGHRQAVEDERRGSPDEETFYRTSQSYLYDLTAFAASGTKAPYLGDLRALLPRGARVLDYGCGIGSDGLRLAADGFEVAFADFDNPSTRYLTRRLARRGLDAAVYDLDTDQLPGGFDAVMCFDVIEHAPDPFSVLGKLESLAKVVVVNLLEDDEDDTELHRPLPIAGILEHARRRGLLRYRRYHGRSHLLAYASGGGPSVSPWRSRAERHVGGHLRGREGWYPMPGR